MKCPKCGHTFVKIIKDKMYCVNFDCVLSYEHQQRLERVLSKMMKQPKGIYNTSQKYMYVGETGITIEYGNGKFYLEDNNCESVQISLDTVESLIKDLEGNND